MTATGIDPTPFTIAHFIVMAVFAALVIVGILWGMKLKRRRRHAADDFEAHRAAAAEPAATQSSGQEDAAAPAAAQSQSQTQSLPPRDDAEPEAGPASPADNGIAADPAGGITQLKGLGPKLAATLEQLGITRVDQIATMSPAELDALDAQLGAFRGRPARDRWAEQARLLTAGDRAAYEAEFGKLGS